MRWHYYSAPVSDSSPRTDLKSERPACREHGALPLWFVIDTQYPIVLDRTVPPIPKPAVIAIATVDDLPCVIRDGRSLARILPRFLREPILVADARKARASWKHRRPLRHPSLFSIDMAVLSRREWDRKAA